jgi:DNA replication protein
MKQFAGFPARMEFTPIPNLFFSRLLPEIEDLAELKTTLHLLALLYRKKGYPQYVRYAELLGDVSLMTGLGGKEEILRGALEMASKRGTILKISADKDGASEDIYLLNTEQGRQAAAKIESGEIKLSGFTAAKPRPAATEPQPDVFTLYEQNIGMLTPLIADELKEAEKLYPQEWLRDAIKEAVVLNKRNIRYIMRILERWSAEGKTDGTHKRDIKKDPDRYLKGKYGHLIQH